MAWPNTPPQSRTQTVACDPSETILPGANIVDGRTDQEIYDRLVESDEFSMKNVHHAELHQRLKQKRQASDASTPALGHLQSQSQSRPTPPRSISIDPIPGLHRVDTPDTYATGTSAHTTASPTRSLSTEPVQTISGHRYAGVQLKKNARAILGNVVATKGVTTVTKRHDYGLAEGDNEANILLGDIHDASMRAFWSSRQMPSSAASVATSSETCNVINEENGSVVNEHHVKTKGLE